MRFLLSLVVVFFFAPPLWGEEGTVISCPPKVLEALKRAPQPVFRCVEERQFCSTDAPQLPAECRQILEGYERQWNNSSLEEWWAVPEKFFKACLGEDADYHLYGGQEVRLIVFFTSCPQPGLNSFLLVRVKGRTVVTPVDLNFFSRFDQPYFFEMTRNGGETWVQILSAQHSMSLIEETYRMFRMRPETGKAEPLPLFTDGKETSSQTVSMYPVGEDPPSRAVIERGKLNRLFHAYGVSPDGEMKPRKTTYLWNGKVYVQKKGK